MRELLVVLATVSLSSRAQGLIELPPPELDQAVRQNPRHFADRVAVFPASVDRIEADSFRWSSRCGIRRHRTAHGRDRPGRDG